MSEPAAFERRVLSDQTTVDVHRGPLEEFVSTLRSALAPHLVDLRLFGSVARGDARPDSDIDVLVVVEPHTERRRLANEIVDIAFKVNLAHNVYISPRVVTPEILNDPVWRQTGLLQAIERESVPL
jgi:predicted nucleotidyltransferase